MNNINNKKQVYGKWSLKESTNELVYKDNNYTYEIDLDTITNAKTILNWIFHISTKSWVNDVDISNLITAFVDLYGFKYTRSN